MTKRFFNHFCCFPLTDDNDADYDLEEDEVSSVPSLSVENRQHKMCLRSTMQYIVTLSDDTDANGDDNDDDDDDNDDDDDRCTAVKSQECSTADVQACTTIKTQVGMIMMIDGDHYNHDYDHDFDNDNHDRYDCDDHHDFDNDHDND